MQRRYIQCLKDGEPVVLDDYPFFNEILDDARRYDVRATRAGADLLSLTWRDVTGRFLAAKGIAASEETYRLLAENAGDVIVHIRDGRIVWVSPSVEAALSLKGQVRAAVIPGHVCDDRGKCAGGGVTRHRES